MKAILELRLHRLTALGRDEIGGELEGLAKTIGELLEILGNRARLYEVMLEEFDAVEAEFATPRVSEITAAFDGLEDEDLIEVEDMVVTVTMTGYIKRTPLALFREQKRGGKGRSGMSTKDEDIVTELFVTSTHNPVLFFSNIGRVYRMKVWRLPEGGPTAKGRPMVNLLPLAEGETITTVLPLPQDEAEWGGLHIMFATAKGTVRRNSMDAFTNIPTAGKIAMKFGTSRGWRGGRGQPRPDHRRRAADRGGRRPARDPQRQGDPLQVDRRARIPEPRLDGRARRPAAWTTTRSSPCRSCAASAPRQEEREAYLKCPAWREKDAECTLPAERYAEIAEGEQFLLTITENGYGKRSSTYEYRRTNRGGQGIINIVTSERNGGVVASFPVKPGEQLMLVTDQGKMIRTTVGDIRIAGRNTQGVTIFNVAENEKVVSVAKIDESEEEEIELEGGDELAPETGATVGEDLASGDDA